MGLKPDTRIKIRNFFKKYGKLIGIIAFVLGVLVSFIVGIFVIKFLLNYLKKGSFKIFAIYRVIVGILVIAIYIWKK